jgi:internalin A
VNTSTFGDAAMKELKHFPHLAFIQLERSQVTHQGLKEIQGLKKIYWIQLGGRSVTDDTLRTLRELGVLHALRPTDYHGSSTFPTNEKGPANSDEVTSLDLEATQMSDAGLKELHDFKNLRKFYTSAGITNAGLKELHAFPQLTDLRLRQCKITDAGLQDLVPLQNLTSLNLDGAQVTDAGLDELKKLNNLTKLSVHQTKVTYEGARAFERDRPNCRVENAPNYSMPLYQRLMILGVIGCFLVFVGWLVYRLTRAKKSAG